MIQARKWSILYSSLSASRLISIEETKVRVIQPLKIWDLTV